MTHSLIAADGLEAQPVVRTIGVRDIREALARGLDDFNAMPSHAVFLCLVYPLAGVVLVSLAFGYQVLPIIYPLILGFALIGPFAAIAFYESSRRRELGHEADWLAAIEVYRSPAIGSIALIGVILTVIFFAWLFTAQMLYQSLFGYAVPASLGEYARQVFGTREGWLLILIGNGIGFLFGVVVFTISVVSLPLLVDRDVGAAEAILTSTRAVVSNPGPMALWAIIVSVLLLLGSLPFFLGLAIVLPILGHATWHLYRRLVEAAPESRPLRPIRSRGPRYAADFPVVLFPWTKDEPRR